MSRKGKRGAIELEQFAKYLLVLAAFAVLVPFAIKFFGIFQQEGPAQACRTSVTLRTTLHWDKKITNVYPLQCKTEQVMIPDPKELPRNPTEDQIKREVYTEIGDMMATCWWMFGNGRYHNLLDDKYKDDELCHACYSFTINPRYATIKKDGQEKTIDYSLEELNLILANVPYSPGLLQGGGAMVGDAGEHAFTPQEVAESSNRRDRITADKLLNSRIRNLKGVADYTGIFAEHQNELQDLRTQLSRLSEGGALAPVFILVPSLPEEDLAEGGRLPAKIMDQWNVGDSTLQNGIVILISLNDGKALFATGYGSAGVLYASDINDAMSGRFDAEMAAKDPASAIIGLAEDLKDNIESKKFVAQKLRFQQSYLGYITGGTRAFDLSSDDAYYGNDDITVQGSVRYEEDMQTISPGDYYAITYINSYWRDQANYKAITWIGAGVATVGILTLTAVTGGVLVVAAYGAIAAGSATTVAGIPMSLQQMYNNNAKKPNMIGLTSYEGLLKNSICNMNLDEG